MPTCPHCGYEAKEQTTSECPLCGSRMRGSVATAGPASDPAAAGGEPVAWEDPAVPFFEGLWRTWKESVFEPGAFFSRLPRGAGLGRPVLYLLILSVAAAFISLAWTAVFTSAGEPLYDYGTNLGAGALALLNFFITPFAALLWLGVFTLFLHPFALLLSDRPRPITSTARGLCYVVGPYVFAIVPALGSLVGAVWAVVLEVVAMREIHRTSTGRALLIVFAVPILLIIMGIVLAILIPQLAVA